MKELKITHMLWRGGVPVTRLTYPHRTNGQTCLIRTIDLNVARVGVDDLQSI